MARATVFERAKARLEEARKRAKGAVIKKNVVDFVKFRGREIQSTLLLAKDFVAKRSNADSKYPAWLVEYVARIGVNELSSAGIVK